MMWLYGVGLLTGTNEPSDQLDDLHHVDRAYLSAPRNHLWVAEINDRVVGMIGLVDVGSHVAQIRRLRIAPQWHETDLPCRLVRVAVKYAQEHGYLKIVLSTHFHPDRKMHFLSELGFQHGRTTMVENKAQMEFYVNLYQDADTLDVQVGQ